MLAHSEQMIQFENEIDRFVAITNHFWSLYWCNNIIFDIKVFKWPLCLALWCWGFPSHCQTNVARFQCPYLLSRKSKLWQKLFELCGISMSQVNHRNRFSILSFQWEKLFQIDKIHRIRLNNLKLSKIASFCQYDAALCVSSITWIN